MLGGQLRYQRGKLMKFLKYDLGNLSRGEIVEIGLTGSAANVRLLDSSNMSNYEHGRQHRYIGGLATRSPIHLQVPNSGHWYVAVDMNGLRGSTNASVNVFPNALPQIREQPLSSLPSLNLTRYDLDEDNIKREYDVFVSHASEEFSPSLADKVARNTSNYTIEEIAQEIAEVVKQ
jgi:hypothetical protein